MQDTFVFKRFHRDIVTLKAHSWKYWFDIYEGCVHNCLYCLYRRDPSFGKTSKQKRNSTLENVKRSLQQIKGNSGIVYLGSTSDVYQPIEAEMQITRGVLQLFLDYEIPIVLGTKSPLILRDIDVLKKLASKNLVEVSPTVITLDDSFAGVLEPNAPSVAERLNMITELHKNGIPTYLHVAPFIPGYFTPETLNDFVQTLKDAGAGGMYSCILGIRDAYKDLLFERVGAINTDLLNYLVNIYGIPEKRNAASPLTQVVFEEMNALRKVCTEVGFPLSCEHIPVFDTQTRTGGFFDYKLPTTGDMYRFFTSEKAEVVTWNMLLDYLQTFVAFDEQYESIVKAEWEKGRLFQDTFYHPIYSGNMRIKEYQLKKEIDLMVSEVMICE